MGILKYLLLSTVCLSFSYVTFRVFFMNETGFRKQRLFIISSVLVSMLLPLNGTTISLPGLSKETIDLSDTIQQLMTASGEISSQAASPGFFASNGRYLISAYLFIMMTFAAFMVIQLVRIMSLSILSAKSRYDKLIVLTNPKIKSPFSFFHFVFMPESISDDEERNEILIHESIHALQYHTIDNLLIEILTAAMWFNPFAWMLKKSLHLVHEYLADEGTLNRGIDRIRYQSLLINQITEEKLIRFSSGFSKTLIKKRMIMMTKSKDNKKGRFGLIALLPMAATMFVTVAFLNGLFPKETKAERFAGFSILQQAPLKVNSVQLQQDTSRDKKVKIRTVEGKKSDLKEITVIGYASTKTPDSLIYIVDGARVKAIDKIDPDLIESVNVMKDDNLIVIRTKKYSEKKRAEKENPGGIRLRGDSGNIIYIIDGKEIDDKEVETLDPAEIESISVLKEGSEVSKYTDRDVDGIIIIKTKNPSAH